MKKLFLLVLVLALWLAGQGLAPAAEKAGGAAAGEDVQDVLYLGEGRPALLRLRIRVDNRPVFAGWAAFMERYFKYLDRNGSGGLDRLEVTRAPSSQTMFQFFMGNPYVNNARTRVAEVKFEDLDTERDGKVTLEEFSRFYHANGAGPVVVQQANAYVAGQDTLTGRLFEMLDTDSDGKLSSAELGATERVLTRFDSSDDELVSSLELGGFQTYGRRAGGAVRAPAPGTVYGRQATTLVLIPSEEGGSRAAGRMRVARELLSRFDKDRNNRLSQQECGFPKGLFAKLDRNRDELLDTLELARLTSGKPEAEFTVRLGGGGAMMARPAMPASPAKGDDRSVTLDNVKLTVVSQSLAGVRGNRGIETFLLNQFRNVDKDRKGYVQKKQLNPQIHFYVSTLFDLADRNNDARLTEEELKAWTGLVGSGAGMNVNLSLASTGQGLFQALDTSADGQLSVREMRRGWKNLSAFDRDGDGSISREEFPQQFRLTVSQGPGYAYAPQVGMGRQPQLVSTSRGPTWFRKMDRNGDGDVSPAEWLGTKADFARADADRDGLLSPEEAEAFDAKARGK